MSDLLDRFHRVLVREIRKNRPEYLEAPFTVAEIYQNIVPYRTHRDLIGVEMNGDYEDALLRLLSGEGEFLILESTVARREILEELESSNPNTGLFRDFAAADVRLTSAHESVDAGDDLEGESDGLDTSDLADLLAEADESESSDDLDDDEDDEEDQPEDDPIADRDVETTEVKDSPPDGDAEVCHWCREDLPERNVLNYCPFCGSDLRLKPCAGCNEELEPGWLFCPACGTGSDG